jgi:hypothetical protein
MNFYLFKIKNIEKTCFLSSVYNINTIGTRPLPTKKSIKQSQYPLAENKMSLWTKKKIVRSLGLGVAMYFLIFYI